VFWLPGRFWADGNPAVDQFLPLLQISDTPKLAERPSGVVWRGRKPDLARDEQRCGGVLAFQEASAEVACKISY